MTDNAPEGTRELAGLLRELADEAELGRTAHLSALADDVQAGADALSDTGRMSRVPGGEWKGWSAPLDVDPRDRTASDLLEVRRLAASVVAGQFDAAEVAKRARLLAGRLAGEPAPGKSTGGTAQRPLPEPVGTKYQLGSAIAVQQAAEDFVRRRPWPGRNALAKELGCSPSLLTKVVKQSVTLRGATARARAQSPEEQREVKALIDEQAGDRDREARQAVEARRRGGHVTARGLPEVHVCRPRATPHNC